MTMPSSNHMQSKAHTWAAEQLPVYAAGGLSASERQQVEQHLEGCPACQADLALWGSLADEIRQMDVALQPPPALRSTMMRVVANEKRISPGQRITYLVANICSRFLLLLRSQVPLVRSEIWPTSAAVIAIGLAVSWISGSPTALRILAPLVAAASMAVIYGPENDPAFELALAAPTSPRQILFARLVLVFSYNLAITLAASFGLLSLVGPQVLGGLILGWLTPMAFLSALALALSLWIGPTQATSIVYGVWLMQFVSFEMPANSLFFGLIPSLLLTAMEAYTRFWQDPAVLLSLTAVVVGLTFWIIGHTQTRLITASDSNR